MRHEKTAAERVDPDGKGAVTGLVFGVTSVIQYLQTEIFVGAFSYSFPCPCATRRADHSARHLRILRDSVWENYDEWEHTLVGIVVLTMITAEYTLEVGDAIANNQPLAGVGAFLLTIAAWGAIPR